jgi:hypothetical protein
MNIVKMKLKDLKTANYNPRKNLQPSDREFQQIKKSIEEFGYIQPIIVNNRTNTIVGGHQRAKVLDILGYKEVDCILADFNEQQEKAANIALNSAQGDWDFDKLKELLQTIIDFNMNDFGNFEELEEELINIEDNYLKEKESETTNNHILKIDKYEIPLNDEEHEELITKIKDYLKINGVLFGFYQSLKG